MSTAIDRAWAFLMQAEGGGALVTDAGGLTKYGISQRAYPDEDIRNMTEWRAQVLFRRDYWEACQCDQLPPALAVAVVDAAFNQGVSAAITLLQHALKVPVDGVMGPVTIAAAQRQGRKAVNEFLARRLMRYAAGESAYQRGWFLRVLNLKDAVQEFR